MERKNLALAVALIVAVVLTASFPQVVYGKKVVTFGLKVIAVAAAAVVTAGIVVGVTAVAAITSAGTAVGSAIAASSVIVGTAAVVAGVAAGTAVACAVGLGGFCRGGDGSRSESSPPPPPPPPPQSCEDRGDCPSPPPPGCEERGDCPPTPPPPPGGQPPPLSGGGGNGNGNGGGNGGGGNGGPPPPPPPPPPQYNVCANDGTCIRVQGSGSDQCSDPGNPDSSSCSQPPPSCTSFTSSPQKLVYPPAKGVTLSWSCVKAHNGCTITDNNPDAPDIGQVPASGSAQTPALSKTTDYVLQCTGRGGTSPQYHLPLGVLRVYQFGGGALKEVAP